MSFLYNVSYLWNLNVMALQGFVLKSIHKKLINEMSQRNNLTIALYLNKYNGG